MPEDSDIGKRVNLLLTYKPDRRRPERQVEGQPELFESAPVKA